MKKLLIVSLLILSLLVSSASALIDLSASVEPLALSGNYNTPISGQFQLSAPGETVNHTVRFTTSSLTHTSESSRTLSISSITDTPVTAGSTTNVNFNIASSSNLAGTYAGTITGTSTSDNSKTDNLAVQVTINSNPSATVSAASFSAGRGLSRTAYQAFTVTNNGNTHLSSFSISLAGDLTDGTNTLPQSYITFSPSASSINYQQSATVDVNTNIPSTQATGTYSGTITVSYGGSSTATANIQIVVREAAHQISVTGNEVVIGDANQLRNSTASKSFYVQNTGDYTEQVSLELSGVSTKYLAQLSTLSFSLQPGRSQSVTAQVTVPKDQDAGIQSLGNIKMTYGQQTTYLPLRLETKNMIAIDKIETEVGGDSSDSNLGDGGTLSDAAKPGEEIEFKVHVKTLYTSADDVDLQNIVVSIEPKDEDLFDIQETDEFDINAGSTPKQKSLKITVPEKINEGSYDLDIIVEGEDENGAAHSVTYTVTFDVNKDDNDVRITEATLASPTLKCTRSTQLRVTIANYGAKDQEKAALAIFNSALGINENVMKIFLDSDYEDSDNDFTKTVSIDLPANFKAGTYPITIKAFRNDDTEEEQQIVNLKVEDCEPVTPVEPVKPDNTTVVVTPTTPSDVVETEEGSFTSSSTFIWLLVGLNVVMLLAIIGLVVKFLI